MHRYDIRAPHPVWQRRPLPQATPIPELLLLNDATTEALSRLDSFELRSPTQEMVG